MNDLGIHVFEQHEILEWEIELVTFNLLSALSWKRFHGPIHLYCNKTYLETLKKWGVDCVYDYINVDLLENKPDGIDYNQYWAFSKIITIRNLIEKEKSFTLIDNDLWLRKPLSFSEDHDVMMYHEEEFDINFEKNIYVDFDYMIDDNLKDFKLDKNTLPTNAALLHVKSPNVLIEWVDSCFETAKYNFGKTQSNEHTSTKMCFVEQRLLPMILRKGGYTYSTFISQKYLTQMVDFQDGSEWYPRLENSTIEEQIKFDNIKHIWGLKKVFHIENIRQMILNVTLNDLTQYEIKDKPYVELIIKLVQSL
jgi:hypothetical protein